jgi:uncharacterized membrane protein YqgA involved in biofilm formation
MCLFVTARDLWISPDPANVPRDIFLAIAVGIAGIVGWLANRSLYLKSAVMLAAAVASVRIGVHRWADGSHATVIIYTITFFFFIGELITAINGIVKLKKAGPGSLGEAG